MSDAEAVAENIAEQTQAAIEGAEARATAAEEINEQLTEAALRDKLSSRIADCEEGIEECENQNAEIAGDLQALETELRHQTETVAEMRGILTTLQETVTAQLSSNPRLSPAGLPKPSEPKPEEQNPDNPMEPSPSEKEGEGDHQDQKTGKQRRHRLI